MYKIIGGDQSEYGPVSAEQICQWVAEGRANGQTRVKFGEGKWKPLAQFPEFAGLFSAKPPPLAPPPFGTGAAPSSAAEIRARPAVLDIGACFQRAFDLLRENFGLLLGASLLTGLCLWFVSIIPFGPLILNGPLLGGFYLLVLKRLRGEPATVNDAFSGFNFFLPLMLVGLVSSLLTGIGMVFCVLPGLFLMVAWAFAIPLTADRRLEFWDALELSRKTTGRVWFQTAILLLVSWLPTVICTIILSVMSFSAALAFFNSLDKSGPFDPAKLMPQIMAIATAGGAMVMVTVIVKILNLAFAAAALAAAYEQLFGNRNDSGR